MISDFFESFFTPPSPLKSDIIYEQSQKCFHYYLMIHTYIIVQTPNLGAFKMVGGILSFRRPIPQKMAAGWVWPCTHGVVPFWNVVFAGWYIAAASIGLVTKRQRLPLSFTQKYLTYGPELGHCKVKQAYLWHTPPIWISNHGLMVRLYSSISQMILMVWLECGTKGFPV